MAPPWPFARRPLPLVLAAVLGMFVLLPLAGLADRLLWLHAGHPVLGAVNLDNLPELRGLCPQASAWVEVKEDDPAGVMAYRCEDGTWFWPFPTSGRSRELGQFWRERTHEGA